MEEATPAPGGDESVATPQSAGRPAVKILRGLASVAIVAGIFLGVLPRIANYSDVWATIADMTSLELGTLVLIALWNLVTYWFVMVAALPGLRYPQAAVVNQASTAISNTLPGGGAIGVGVTFAMDTSWGFTTAAITRSIVVSGIWNNFMKLGFPIVALGLLAITGDVSAALVTAALVGLLALFAAIGLFALVLKSEAMARRVGDGLGRLVSALIRPLRKPPVVTMGDATVRFRADTIDLLRTRWLWLTLASFVSHSSLYLVLLVALRHVGVGEDELGWVTVLAAFAFVRLISALPVTPGGVGVVELGYAASLTIGMDAALRAQVVAAILVFRFLTFFLPIPLGAASYVFWRTNKSWRKEAADTTESVQTSNP
jgi:uncharacterized membrane protein YbhN (UPF0104 family)